MKFYFTTQIVPHKQKLWQKVLGQTSLLSVLLNMVSGWSWPQNEMYSKWFRICSFFYRLALVWLGLECRRPWHCTSHTNVHVVSLNARCTQPRQNCCKARNALNHLVLFSDSRHRWLLDFWPSPNECLTTVSPRMFRPIIRMTTRNRNPITTVGKHYRFLNKGFLRIEFLDFLKILTSKNGRVSQGKGLVSKVFWVQDKQSPYPAVTTSDVLVNRETHKRRRWTDWIISSAGNQCFNLPVIPHSVDV